MGVADWIAVQVYDDDRRASRHLMPGYTFRQGYEFRTSPTLVERRCDGIEMDDGSECACNAQGLEDKAACDLITRLTVALPELTTMLGRGCSHRRARTPRASSSPRWISFRASLTVVRSSLRSSASSSGGASNGQDGPLRRAGDRHRSAIRDPRIGSGGTSRELAALPAGYIPIEPKTGNGASLADGLAAAETQTLKKPPRVALPDDDVEDEDPGASVPPVRADDTPAPQEPSDVGNTMAASTRDKPRTKAQATKLDVLVGTLRDTLSVITTEDLYKALAKTRNIAVDLMIDVLSQAYSPDGVLHWAPLRDSLTRAEASDLIERLQAKESGLPKAAA